MPRNLTEALRALIGQQVVITTNGGTFKGTLAAVTHDLVVLASDSGVVYINPQEINAVSTC